MCRRAFISVAALTLLSGFSEAQEMPEEVRTLLGLHAELIDAHRTGDVEAWMAIEDEAFVSVNGGRVSFPRPDERRARREAYLEGTRFDVYRDLREPVVRISADRTLGWVVAEVEVRGVRTSPEGGAETFHDVWAWVELYRRIDGRWRLVGNASNRRAGRGVGPGTRRAPREE